MYLNDTLIVGINFSLHVHVMCIIKDLISAKKILILEKKTYGACIGIVLIQTMHARCLC